MGRNRISWNAIQRILAEHPPVDEYTAYYRQFEIPHRRVGAPVPKTLDLLRGAMTPQMRVLDIGCGRGKTLLDCAALFRHGDGIDESADVMIAQAQAERSRRGVRNVHFQAAKAAALPFEADAFDLVFSERGPMGHNDITLREALRVLQRDGLIFIEMIGDWNSWETRIAFEPGFVKSTSPLELLEVERQRLERHGVQIRTLASRLETLVFNSFDDWLHYQLQSWSPPGREVFREDNLPAVDRFLDIASSTASEIHITAHTLWLAGVKSES